MGLTQSLEEDDNNGGDIPDHWAFTGFAIQNQVQSNPTCSSWIFQAVSYGILGFPVPCWVPPHPGDNAGGQAVLLQSWKRGRKNCTYILYALAFYCNLPIKWC